MRHNFFGEGNSLWLLDMGTSWYFSWKLNHFGILKCKQGLFNIPQSVHESVYLLEPSFHSRTPNNSTFMKNISWCPCLKVRVNFLPRRNYAAHFTVGGMLPRAACHWLTKSEFASYWLTQSATYSILPPAQASCCSTLDMLSSYIVRGTVRHKFALTFCTEI